MSDKEPYAYIYKKNALETTRKLNHVNIYINIDGKIQVQKITFEMLILLSKIPEIYDKIDMLQISKQDTHNMRCIHKCRCCIPENNEEMPIIDTIPPLPKNLKYLDIRSTEITELPELPEGLIKLYCKDNPQLTTIKNVPHSIKYFTAYYCNLTHIPNFPENAETINIYGNWKLGEIPSFPDNTKYINIQNCTIRKIDKFPSKLINIDCSVNCLKYLPNLPSSLEYIYCNENKLLELPKLIHLSKLQLFDCSNNQIKYIPPLPPIKKSIDDTNYSFNISYNKVKMMPYNIIDIFDDINIITDTINIYYNDSNAINIIGNPINDFLSDKEINREILENVLKQHNAINKIENAYITAKYHPDYQMCKEKVKNTFVEMYE